MRSNRPAQRLRDREIAGAVGKLDHLLQEAIGRVKGGVNIPQRAGAAEFGEWEGAGGEAFGDVAGVVDTQQEERNAARIRPLQGGEAMTDLLEAGVEALRQHMHVVA